MQREYCGSAAARAQSRPVEIRPRAGRDSAAIRLPTDTTAAREREESSEVVCLEELTRCQLIVYDACCKLRPLVFYIVQGGARGARLHVRTSVLTKRVVRFTVLHVGGLPPYLRELPTQVYR